MHVFAGVFDASVFEDVDLLKELSDKVYRPKAGLAGRSRRHEIVRSLIDMLVTDLCTHTLARIEEMRIRSTDDARRAPESVVAFSPDLAERRDALQRYLFEHVYHHYRVARMSSKAKRFIKEIFGAYVADPRQLPPDYQAWAATEGLEQGICDYIAGMTDRYAQDEYKKLFTPYERV